MEKKDVLDASSDRMNKRLRRQMSHELVAEARKRGSRGPEPGAGGRPLSEAPKTFRASVRFSESEEALIKEATLNAGETMAEFIRTAAIAKAGLTAIR